MFDGHGVVRKITSPVALPSKMGVPPLVFLYAALALLPFAVGGAIAPEVLVSPIFWAAFALVLGLVVALAYRRRWAWFLLLAFEFSVLVSFLLELEDAVALALVMQVARVVILVSPPVRRHVSGHVAHGT
jgi:hypothetical protein